MKYISLILAYCLIITFVVSLSSCGNLNGLKNILKSDITDDVETIVQTMPAETEPPTVQHSYNVGDVITLGKYEQDNDITNGKEDIKWHVASVYGNRALLVSKCGLERINYDDASSASTTWETCSLRVWLNDIFYNEAFDLNEQNMIVLADVNAEQYADYPDVDPGNHTKDKVFVLSDNEADKYLHSTEMMMCPATEYAIAKGASVSIYDDSECWWWLRSPGKSTAPAVDVYFYNSAFGTNVCNINGYHADTDGVAVRPAVWINTMT